MTISTWFRWISLHFPPYFDHNHYTRHQNICIKEHSTQHGWNNGGSTANINSMFRRLIFLSWIATTDKGPLIANCFSLASLSCIFRWHLWNIKFSQVYARSDPPSFINPTLRKLGRGSPIRLGSQLVTAFKLRGPKMFGISGYLRSVVKSQGKYTGRMWEQHLMKRLKANRRR